jgi:hypothetical protein
MLSCARHTHRSLFSVLHNAELRKQRAAAAGVTLPAPLPSGSLSGQLSLDGAGSSDQQLQSQPSLAEGQVPLSEEIR